MAEYFRNRPAGGFRAGSFTELNGPNRLYGSQLRYANEVTINQPPGLSRRSLRRVTDCRERPDYRRDRPGGCLRLVAGDCRRPTRETAWPSTASSKLNPCQGVARAALRKTPIREREKFAGTASKAATEVDAARDSKMRPDDEYEARKLERRKRRRWENIAGRIGCAFFGMPFVASLVATIVVRDGALYSILVGAVCFLVGCIYFVTQEDEYLVPLLVGVQALIAAAAVQSWRLVSDYF